MRQVTERFDSVAYCAKQISEHGILTPNALILYRTLFLLKTQQESLRKALACAESVTSFLQSLRKSRGQKTWQCVTSETFVHVVTTFKNNQVTGESMRAESTDHRSLPFGILSVAGS